MDSNQIRQIIKNLNIVMRCPKCGKRYGLEEIFLQRSVGTTYFLQLNCSNCHNPVYASIALSGNMAPKEIPKTIPEAASKTMPKVSSKENSPITSDDIIEIHEILKNYKGKISDII